MAKPKKRLICFDACVVIDSLNPKSTRFPPIDEILKRAELGAIKIWVSALALIETVKLQTAEDYEEEERQILGFFDRKYVEFEAVNRQVAKKARTVRRDHEIDQFDAMHVATALCHDCEALITIDGIRKKKSKTPKLLSFNEKIEDLRIITPSELAKDYAALWEGQLADYDETVAKKRRSDE